MEAKKKLSLRDVLFVPSCGTHLVSVSVLTRDGYNFMTFGPSECWISDWHNKVIVQGSLSLSKSLYVLNCASARVAHSKAPFTALYSKQVPDLET
jgi:hypothetical protein